MPEGLEDERTETAIRRIEWVKLSNGRRLDLCALNLTAVPDSVAQLVELEALYLSNNQLTTIPDWLAQLVKLRELYLDKNRLVSIPDSLARLEKLELLHLDDNPLPDELLAALRRGIESFCRYLRSTAATHGEDGKEATAKQFRRPT